MKKLLLAAIVLMLIQGCNKCEDMECTTPPGTFVFELVDKETRENLFTNGTYSADDITLTETGENVPVDFSFANELGLNQIFINGPWDTSVVHYNLKINNESIFTVKLDSKRTSEDCCDFTRYNEIAVEGAEYEVQSDGVYLILIP